MADNTDQFVLKSMPYFIATHYQRMLEATSTEEMVAEALRVYELGMRTLGMAVVSQYLMRDYDQISNFELNRLLETKLANASLNTWQSIFFFGLKAYGGHRDLLFVKQLYDFYWDVSTHPHIPRANIEASFIRLTEVYNLFKRIKPKDEEAWLALSQEILNLLRQIFTHFSFFQEYDLVLITKRDGNQYWYKSYMGLEPALEADPLTIDADLGTGWFYLAKDRKDFLKMHPLLIVWDEFAEKPDIAVYDRYLRDDNLLQYLRVALWQFSVNQANVADFILMLYATLEQKRVREAYTQLNWLSLREVANTISEHQMSAVSGKYQTKLYLQRKNIREAFESFLASDKAGFVLTGQSGVGKSNFVLSLVEEFMDKRSRVCLLMFDGAHLDPGYSLTKVVGEQFDRYLRLGDREKISNVWQEIDCIEDIDERKVVIVIDAINENPRARELLQRIDELIAESNWAWLKIVVTCRPEAWRTIKLKVRLSDSEYYREPGKDKLEVELEPFSHSKSIDPFSRDELPVVYEKYQEASGLKTPYGKLSPFMRKTLRDPLLLRLVADIYKEQEIPSRIKPTEIYELYLDVLVKTMRLRVEDLRFLTQELMPMMAREGHLANVISAKEINMAVTKEGESFFDLIHNDGLLPDGSHVNQSYLNLADVGILGQRGNALNYEIGFRYERFYDYHAGKRLWEINAGAADKVTAYLQQMQLTQKQQYLWGPVKYALIRELADGNQAMILELCRKDEYIVRNIMAAVLKEYGQEKPDVVHEILTELMNGRTRSLPSQILAGISNLAKKNQELSPKRIAVDVAGTLGFSEVLARAASESSSSLRFDAIRQIFYLWRNDRNELFIVTENRGINTLQHLQNKTTAFMGIPHIAALESFFAISLLMFLEDTADTDLHQKLQIMLRVVIDQVFHTNRWMGRILVRSLLGGRLMSFLVNFISSILAEIPRYYIGDIEEFKAFFSLKNEQRLWLRSILPYLDPDHGKIEEVADLLKQMSAVDVLLMDTVIALALVAHGRKRPTSVVPIIAELFDDILSRSPRGAGSAQHLSGALYEVLRVQKEINEEQWRLADHFASAPLDDRRGELLSRSGRKYFSQGLLYISLLYIEKLGEPCLHLWRRYLGLAVDEENWVFLEDLLHMAGELAVAYHAPNAAFSIIRELPPLDNKTAIQKLLEVLTRIRFYYPDLVDDFFYGMDYPESYLSYIRESTFKEPLMQVVFSRFVSYVIDALRTASFRTFFSSAIDSAIDSANLGGWVNFLLRKFANMAYGAQIFSEK